MAELGLEIESLFAGLRNKENSYLGRIASLEEQTGLLREAQRQAAFDSGERERVLSERLAAAENAASAAAYELKKFRGERGEPDTRSSGFQAALADKDKEIRKMWSVLERARKELLSQREALKAGELEITERAKLISEREKELENSARRLALIAGRLKAAARPPAGKPAAPPQETAGPAPGGDDAGYQELPARYDDLNCRLLQLEESRNSLDRELAAARRENEELKAGRPRAEEAASLEIALRIPGQEENAPAAGGDADKYKELLSRYDELGDRLLQLEERKNALERELQEEEQLKTELRRKNLQIQREADVKLLAVDEKMRRKDVELEELRAALEKTKRGR